MSPSSNTPHPPPSRLAPIFYSTVPRAVQWAEDTFSKDFRNEAKADAVLHRIDQFIFSLQSVTDDGQKKYMLCELFFATNYWLNNPSRKGVHQPGWYKVQAAVSGLKAVVRRTLAHIFRCAEGQVPDVLSRCYGCPMTAHGIYVDDKNPVAKANYEKFKIYFDKGLAWGSNPLDLEGGGLQKVNTRGMFDGMTRPKKWEESFAFFVMTRYRDLYIAQHRPTDRKYPKYHSSIPEGTAVQCAGSIWIEEGVVKGICNDSGHYQPGDPYFLNVLEQLKAVGVPIKGIKLFDFEGEILVEDAEEFYQAHGNWDEINHRKELNRQRLEAEGGGRRALRFKKRLDILTIGRSRDQALEMLFVEEFRRLNQAGQGGLPLWNQVWKRVLDALFDYADNFKSEDPKFMVFMIDKKEQYKVKPPIAPI